MGKGKRRYARDSVDDGRCRCNGGLGDCFDDRRGRRAKTFAARRCGGTKRVMRPRLGLRRLVCFTFHRSSGGRRRSGHCTRSDDACGSDGCFASNCSSANEPSALEQGTSRGQRGDVRSVDCLCRCLCHRRRPPRRVVPRAEGGGLGLLMRGVDLFDGLGAAGPGITTAMPGITATRRFGRGGGSTENGQDESGETHACE